LETGRYLGEIGRLPAVSGERHHLGAREAQTAVLAAVRGESSYFNVNRGRYRMIGKDGEDEWSPEENGPHMRITEKVSKAEVGRIIDELILRGPCNRK
jgi:hypothetical protein